MRDQLAHHLERARIAARVTVIGTACIEVAPALAGGRKGARPWKTSIAPVTSI